ncbi:phage tail termination protein [Franconibacter daqui]|uniref:phage tail termination protein n=1 Tax=Franconibacter daqui TaxID=2047724 RepID=UPI002DB7F8E2|nr:hypothetical protein [Franconibacter daqui]MEB5922721.1 hypothetical protein [Franconibacter daqui]
MTPPMYERVKNMLTSAGLTDGYKVQLLLFVDSGKPAETFLVFRPGGGTTIRNDLASDYYVETLLIGAKDNLRAAVGRMLEIINYVQDNPTADECVNYIECMGIPSPTLSAEGRPIFTIRFRCVYGD